MKNKRETVKKNKAEASKLGLDNCAKDDHAKCNKGEENKTDEAEEAPARKRRQQLCSLCGEPGRKNTCKCQNKQDNDKEVLPTESDGNNATCDLA
eukprot:scaffold11142_cov37-Attheya_sp.AAC.1